MRLNHKRLDRDLLDAVVMADLAKAQGLLNQGADVNATDAEHDETPLILATKFADAAMVQMLLNAKAEVDARDDTGRTALFFASVTSEVFKVLVEVGANIHARDAEGNTILMRKITESPSLSEVEELLRQGIDPNLRNADGQMAQDLAESLGLVNIVERLRATTAV